MLRLLIATNNPGKLKEFLALLERDGLELITPNAIGLDLNVHESGDTYAENAALKAAKFSTASCLWTLADDSGLEVDALGGLPGLHSARFLNKSGATDAERRRGLLQSLDGQPKPWTARFRCAIALVGAANDISIAEGSCEGEIISEERGLNGFGYDPVFLIPALGKTMAELSLLEKNRISHRAQAARGILPVLDRLIKAQ